MTGDDLRKIAEKYHREWNVNEVFDADQHWWCEYPRYEDYLGLGLPLHAAIYAANSKWGMLISDGMHAVIGGDEVFIGQLRQAYPAWKSEFREFQEYYKETMPKRFGKSEPEWLEGLLERTR